MSPKTLYDKIWDAHVAHEADDGTCLLYIDRHLVHEVTSPQAFEGLRMTGRTVRRPVRTGMTWGARLLVGGLVFGDRVDDDRVQGSEGLFEGLHRVEYPRGSARVYTLSSKARTDASMVNTS